MREEGIGRIDKGELTDAEEAGFEMTEPMQITKEMRDSREEKVSRIIERINGDIKRAAKEGRHECFFDCSKNSRSQAPFYQEARERFERCGYRIKPTGYIGGVWQRTENIEW